MISVRQITSKYSAKPAKPFFEAGIVFAGGASVFNRIHFFHCLADHKSGRFSGKEMYWTTSPGSITLIGVWYFSGRLDQ